MEIEEISIARACDDGFGDESFGVCPTTFF